MTRLRSDSRLRPAPKRGATASPSAAKAASTASPSADPTAWADALDDLAATIFTGDTGAQRVAPLLAHWEQAVGPLREEDPQGAWWQACRTDWALCDAPIDGPGDTWAWRAASGEIDGVQPTPMLRQLAASVTGLWQVTPGRRTWLCDALSGIGVELSSSLQLLDVPGDEAPAGLWEARVVLHGGIAQLCRPPISYPVAVADEVRRQGLSRLSSASVTRHDVLMRLRRRWLHWARAPRADARLLFAR